MELSCVGNVRNVNFIVLLRVNKNTYLAYFGGKMNGGKTGTELGVDEKVALIEEVKARAAVLFGPLKGVGLRRERKSKNESDKQLQID